MSIVDRHTGELVTDYLFVATLPYSQYSYVEPCLDMKQNTWLNCHVNMYNFFDGSTIRLICDNLKTGVISHPREGDIILNEKYEDLGNHYLTAIMPAGVRKPKHKPSVEGTVGKIATAIIARLRNDSFHTFSELKVAVREKLDDFNDNPFQKREGSRSSVFSSSEKLYLRELPSIPYTVADWIYGHRVNIDCHVAFETNRYSAPYMRFTPIKKESAHIIVYQVMLSINGLQMKHTCRIISIINNGMIIEFLNGHQRLVIIHPL